MAFNPDRALPNTILYIALLIASIAILTLSLNTRYLETAEAVLRSLTYPLVFIAYLPDRTVDSVDNYLTSAATLRLDNDRLRQELASLQGTNAELRDAQRRIKELTAALQYQQDTQSAQRLAEIVAVTLDWNRQEVLINLGSSNGISIDSSVLDPDGLYGRVVEVYPKTALVLLINDKRSGVPVLVTRTNEYFVLSGNGAGELFTLDNVNLSSDVRVGDEIVTSGLGEVYPQGYVVGTVESVVDDSSEATKHVTIEPAASFGQKSYLRVLIHDSAS